MPSSRRSYRISNTNRPSIHIQNFFSKLHFLLYHQRNSRKIIINFPQINITFQNPTLIHHIYTRRKTSQWKIEPIFRSLTPSNHLSKRFYTYLLTNFLTAYQNCHRAITRQSTIKSSNSPLFIKQWIFHLSHKLNFFQLFIFIDMFCLYNFFTKKASDISIISIFVSIISVLILLFSCDSILNVMSLNNYSSMTASKSFIAVIN